MKIKVLHAALMIHPTAGILNQMNWEQRAANDLELPWITRVFCPKGNFDNIDVVISSNNRNYYNGKSILMKTFNWILLRFDYYHWLRRQLPHFDVIVLRYHVHDPLQVWFVARSKKPVYFVHHTLEVPELASAGFIGKLRALAETWIGPSSLKRASASIGVTSEIANHQMSRLRKYDDATLIYPNGIKLQDHQASDAREDVPEILFVASYFSTWHGLDLLLDAFAESSENVVLHLVGDLSDEDKERAIQDKRIRLHGSLGSAEIEKLINRCWVGLSSFALNRNNMEEACTLKVREYLSYGLPVFSGHRDVFPIEFPFYQMKYPDLKKIIEYCHEVRNVPREVVAKKAAPYIDKNVLLSNLYISLCKKMPKS